MKNGLLILLIIFNTFCSVIAQGSKTLIKPERVYLHTDRNIYIAGENLFYSLYLKGESGQTSKYAYLIIRDQKNALVTHVRLEIENQRSYGNIYLSDTLKSGYYQIVCYTNLMRISEETFFSKEIVIANRFDEKFEQFPELVEKKDSDATSDRSQTIPTTGGNITIHLDKKLFNTRDKISFSVENKDQTNNPITSLSVSVNEFISGTPVEKGISDYFGPHIENSVENEGGNVSCKFRPEYTAAVLQGRVIPDIVADVTNNSSLNHNNFTVLLSTIDSITNLQYTRTDSLGSFFFYVNPYYEGKEIIVKLKESANATIELDKKSKILQPFIPSASYNFKGLKDYLIRSGKINQIQRYYTKRDMLDTVKIFLSPNTIPRVYTMSSSVILPSDYLELPDFIEISREIIPALKVWKRQDNYGSRYLNLRYQADADAEPMIFLDGVPVDDINQVISLGTTDIKRIESLPAIRYYGELSFPGILSVSSTNQEIDRIQFKTPFVRYKVLGSQAFTKPELFNPEYLIDHHPDLRQVLFWDPEIIPAENESPQIDFYASDLEGMYRINIQGIRSNGDPVNGSAVITIKAK